MRCWINVTILCLQSQQRLALPAAMTTVGCVDMTRPVLTAQARSNSAIGELDLYDSNFP
jgi:hypothetical protein